MRITIIFFLAVTCMNACQSSSSGQAEEPGSSLKLPDDSLAFYFPTLREYPRQDSFVQNWYASTLYALREPILSKGYVGHDVYRFLWLRSFHRPAVFTLHHHKDRVWLATKMLDKYPQFHDQGIAGIREEDREGYLNDGYVPDSNDADLLVRKATIVYNREIELSRKEWLEFEAKLSRAGFWYMPTMGGEQGFDGARWIIEAHTIRKYHVVDRWAPEVKFQKLGLYLIELSGLKEEIY